METNYVATKTANDFHLDNSFVRLLLGPIGCGKSVDCCVEILIRASQQEAGKDGRRRSRWGVIRNTYPELKSTTIKTWLDWFPEDQYGKMRWDSPITHNLHFNDVSLEVIFLALDSETDIKKLMSFEFTGIYINELQYIHPKIFEKCRQRVNRYPSVNSGARITWTGVIADTNPPSTRHWIYNLFEKDKPEGFNLFKYSPALIKVNEPPKDLPFRRTTDDVIYINTDTDYKRIQNDQNYWLNLVSGSTSEEVEVNYCGNYGVITSGRPVHPEYKDRFHFANKELSAIPNFELGLGFDFGLTPACAIVQLSPLGQFRILDELYSERMDLHDLVKNVVLPHLNRKYPWWKEYYISRHDPAGQTGSQNDSVTCQDIMRKLGIISMPAAKTNACVARREGLKYHLRRLANGEAALTVSNTCPQIREGLMGHFQYPKIKANEDTMADRYHDTPLKNMHSHICEALEYIGMYYVQKPELTEDQSDKVVRELAAHYRQTQITRERTWQR